MAGLDVKTTLPIYNQVKVTDIDNKVKESEQTEFFNSDNQKENNMTKNSEVSDIIQNDVSMGINDSLPTEEESKNYRKLWTTLGTIGGVILSGVILKKTGLGRKLMPNVLRPEMNETLTKSNKGLRAVLYGTCSGNTRRPGLVHIFTGANYRNEILQAQSLRGSCSESAVRKLGGISDAIPKKYNDAYLDLKYMDDFMEHPLMEELGEKASRIRDFKDKIFMNPVSAVKRKGYFFFDGLKTNIKHLFKKNPIINEEYVRSVLPRYIKIPEGLQGEELKAFFIESMKKSKFTDKEIKAALQGKSPRFYRFIGETEMKILKNGNLVRPTAEYNLDMEHIDITSNPHYDCNKYRVTFRNRKGMNPFERCSKVTPHDPILKKWWLASGYSKEDIVCCERIR